MHEVIVIGTGGMGSAACYELARRGCGVIGLDRHHPPHDLGGTHGRSRIIRQAYMEAPEYVPLLLSAYPAWRSVERVAGERLLTVTGGLMIGQPDSGAVAGSLRSAREHGLEHELLDSAEVRRRFPPLHLADDEAALYEPYAGSLDPERAVAAFHRLAASHGADMRGGQEVVSWSATDTGVRVRTAAGDRLEADRLVLTPGPWAGGLLRELAAPLTASREVMHWFQPESDAGAFAPERFPVYIWEPAEGPIFYGFPGLDGPDGPVKAAIHHGGRPTTPETADRTVSRTEIDAMRERLARRIPALNGRHVEAAVCLYTNTPDHDFLLGLHPEHPTVALAAGLSGHGFKFAAVIGAILADLATGGATAHPIEPFRPDRPLD